MDNIPPDDPNQPIQPVDNSQDQQDDAELMQALGQEVRAYIDERFAALPEPADAQPPIAPVINVAPANATVEVQVPQALAPEIVVNVPQNAAPIINVETAAPVINVAAPAPAITVQSAGTFEVNATAPIVNVAPTVTIDHADVAKAIDDSSASLTKLIAALVKSIDANVAAIKEQSAILASPKSLVMTDGKPTGVRITR